MSDLPSFYHTDLPEVIGNVEERDDNNNDHEELLAEERENIEHQRIIRPSGQRDQAAVTHLNEPKQDVQGQEKRLQELQTSFLSTTWLCCPTITNIIRAGYLLSEFHRRGRFDDNHQGLNLSLLKHRFHLGMTIKSVQSYRNQIIGLVKPFVRVQIVDIDTGFHLKMPTYTAARPRYTRGIQAPETPGALTWNQELTFDLPYSGLVSERALYLFEIIDEQPSLSVRTNLSNQGLSLFRKVAWGFLIPVGVDGLLNVGLPSLVPELGEGNSVRLDASGEFPRPTPSLEPQSQSTKHNEMTDKRGSAGRDLNLRLQLYEYRQYDGLIGVIQRSSLQWPNLTEPYRSKEEKTYPNDIPSIFLQWKLRRKVQVKGAFLKVAIGPRFAPSSATDNTPTEESDDGEKHDDDDDDANKPSKPFTGTLFKRRRRIKSKDDRMKLKNAALRRTRGPKDPCYVPDRFLYRLDVGPDGAMVVAFSNSGHLLAVASRAPRFNSILNTTEIVYSLLLYDTDLDEEVWAEEIAHHAVIYDIKWSKNDRYLLTCSADGTCKVFDLIALHPLLSLYPGTTGVTIGGVAQGADIVSPRVDDGSVANANNSNNANPAPQTNHLRPHRIIRNFPPGIKCILSLPASVYAYSGLFQEFGPGLSIASYFNPLGLSSAQSSPLALLGGVTMELSQWNDHMNALLQAPVPRVIVGAADGRIRVFDDAELMGYIRVVEQPQSEDIHKPVIDENGGMMDFSPHDGCVNALALDERTKYLISADSVGDVLVWRQDNKGWYQLLRKLRKETMSPTPTTSQPAAGTTMTGTLRRSLDLSSTLNKTLGNNNNQTANNASKPRGKEQFNDGSILSIAIHPDKMKGMMLMMSRQPASLKVLNLATYKPFHACESFTGLSAYLVREGDNVFSTGIFYRASFSADGKFIIACCNVSQEMDRPVYKLLVWDSYTGQPVSSFLSQLTFAYPVRSVTWHPTQHLLAVAMLGPGAAVVLYTTDSSSASSINQQQQHNQQQAQAGFDVTASTSSLPRGALDRSLVGASSLLPPSAFASESLLQPQHRSGENSPNVASLSGKNNGKIRIGAGNTNSSNGNTRTGEKDLLAYSLLNSQSFVNMRQGSNLNSTGTSSDANGGTMTPLLEMSRSNESLLPNMATLQPSNNALLSTNGPTMSSQGSNSTLKLSLAPIVESGAEQKPVTTAAAPALAAPVSDAEARINKMARAREILARARAQRAAASAFADVEKK